MTMRQLGMSQSARAEQFHRAVFSPVGCNQDDHVKNFGFMMDHRQGHWDTAPAHDPCHAGGSDFTRCHQPGPNGRTVDSTREDPKHLVKYAGPPRNRAKLGPEQTVDAVPGWPRTAREHDMPAPLQNRVLRTLRLCRPLTRFAFHLSCG